MSTIRYNFDIPRTLSTNKSSGAFTLITATYDYGSFSKSNKVPVYKGDYYQNQIRMISTIIENVRSLDLGSGVDTISIEGLDPTLQALYVTPDESSVYAAEIANSKLTITGEGYALQIGRAVPSNTPSPSQLGTYNQDN